MCPPGIAAYVGGGARLDFAILHFRHLASPMGTNSGSVSGGHSLRDNQGDCHPVSCLSLAEKQKSKGPWFCIFESGFEIDRIRRLIK